MSSQQNQILGEFKHEDIIANLYARNSIKSNKQIPFTCQSDRLKQNLNGSRSKFNIKKFQQNILKQIITKNPKTTPLSSSNTKSNRTLQSHANNHKQITHQRKISRSSKSKSKKELAFNQIKKENEVFNKTHQTNVKILRQKLLNQLSHFDDYQMINIEDSIPILKQANILKILTSLEETKMKIQSRQLPQGRIKQEAKFIYFLWKMIDQETISTRHLKEIILLLNELNKNQLTAAFGTLYNRDGEIVTLFVQCWLKLKIDRFTLPKNASKDKNLTQNTLNSTKLINPQNHQQSQKTLKKILRSKTQYCEINNEQSSLNDDSAKKTKFLHPNEEKQLISRLYEDRKDFMSRRQRVKTMHDQEKQNIELQKCTFKPLLTTSVHKRSASKSTLLFEGKGQNNQSSCMNNQDSIDKKLQKRYGSKDRSKSKVKGFEKAVVRMKNGQSQTKLKQQLLAYHSVGQNYQKIKQKPMNPPKFLQREKQKKQEMVLFVIEFEIGRHKVKVKIHPTDTQMSVSKKISKIYGLKHQEQQEIREIVSMQLNNYYKNIAEQVSEFIDEN